MRYPYKNPNTAYQISASDSVTLPVSTLYIGNDGDITVQPANPTPDGTSITFENITAPFILPVKVTKVYDLTLLATEAGSGIITEASVSIAGDGRTTCSGIVGMY